MVREDPGVLAHCRQGNIRGASRSSAPPRPPSGPAPRPPDSAPSARRGRRSPASPTWYVLVLVLLQVPVEVGLLPEAPVAQVALEGLLFIMNVPDVPLEVGGDAEGAVAVLTPGRHTASEGPPDPEARGPAGAGRGPGARLRPTRPLPAPLEPLGLPARGSRYRRAWKQPPLRAAEPPLLTCGRRMALESVPALVERTPRRRCPWVSGTRPPPVAAALSAVWVPPQAVSGPERPRPEGGVPPEASRGQPSTVERGSGRFFPGRSPDGLPQLSFPADPEPGTRRAGLPLASFGGTLGRLHLACGLNLPIRSLETWGLPEAL